MHHLALPLTKFYISNSATVLFNLTNVYPVRAPVFHKAIHSPTHSRCEHEVMLLPSSPTSWCLCRNQFRCGPDWRLHGSIECISWIENETDNTSRDNRTLTVQSWLHLHCLPRDGLVEIKEASWKSKEPRWISEVPRLVDLTGTWLECSCFHWHKALLALFCGRTAGATSQPTEMAMRNRSLDIVQTLQLCGLWTFLLVQFENLVARVNDVAQILLFQKYKKIWKGCNASVGSETFSYAVEQFATSSGGTQNGGCGKSTALDTNMFAWSFQQTCIPSRLWVTAGRKRDFLPTAVWVMILWMLSRLDLAKQSSRHWPLKRTFKDSLSWRYFFVFQFVLDLGQSLSFWFLYWSSTHPLFYSRRDSLGYAHPRTSPRTKRVSEVTVKSSHLALSD